MMICIFLHLLLVFCFSPPNISKRFCCWQLFWKAIETRPRRLLVFILGLIQISVTFYAGKNYFFQQVQWLTRWLNLRCWPRIWIQDLASWSSRLLVGLKRLVGYGWKVCWMGVILFWLMMTNSFIVVERRIALCWKSGWLGLRDWLVGVERLVGWGWEIGLLELRDWLVGVERYKRTKVHFVHLQLLQASGSSYCNHATPPRMQLQKWKKNRNLKCNLGPLEIWPLKVMQNQIRTTT